jgi:hypothetical protein
LRSAAHTLTFRGKVRVHIVKPPKDTKPAQKEGVPAAQVMPPMPGESGALPAAQVMPPMPVAQGVPPMPGESGALPDDASAVTAGSP